MTASVTTHAREFVTAALDTMAERDVNGLVIESGHDKVVISADPAGNAITTRILDLDGTARYESWLSDRASDDQSDRLGKVINVSVLTAALHEQYGA